MRVYVTTCKNNVNEISFNELSDHSSRMFQLRIGG